MKGYHFYSPQSSTVIKSKMAATTTLRTRTRFRPPRIRLHCRLRDTLNNTLARNTLNNFSKDFQKFILKKFEGKENSIEWYNSIKMIHNFLLDYETIPYNWAINECYYWSFYRSRNEEERKKLNDTRRKKWKQPQQVYEQCWLF